MLETMRISHCVESFSPLSETFIYDYIYTLRELGLSCDIITQNVIEQEGRSFESVYLVDPPGRWHPSRLCYRTLAQFKLRDKSTTSWPALRRRIKRQLERLAPDVVHAHFGSMGALVYPVARALDLPLVVSFHGVDAFSYPLREPFKTIYPLLFQSVDAVTVVSHVMREHLISLGCPADRIHVVRVGKRIEDYPVVARNGTITKWISVGRLTEKKGFHDALRAFHRIVQDFPEQHLDIIGDGPLYDDLQHFINTHELGSHVTLLGGMPHGAVVAALKEADAFILCSRTAANGDREGVPTVLMEAQLLGLPCVSTRHSGIPEAIPEGNQELLADEGDVKGIAQAIIKLITTTEHKLNIFRKEGRNKIVEQHNLMIETQQLSRLYRELIQAQD